jgi:hypothetical protein
MEYIQSLSMVQIYLASLAIGLIMSWVIQYTDDGYDKGFPVALGVLAFIPYVNICVALIAAFVLVFAIVGTVIMLPSMIKGFRK